MNLKIINNIKSKLYCLSFILLFTIVINTTVINVHAANDGVQKAINVVMQKYPDGSYFSSTGGPCGPGQTDFGYGNYCTYCQLYVIDSAACAVCGNGDSCNAFAKYVFYKVFGIGPYSCADSTCNNLNDKAKVGDFVACYNNSNASGTPAHFLIYMGSAGGSNYYAYEANVDIECIVRYRNAGNRFSSYRVYHANNYDQVNITQTDNEKPTITNVKVSNVTKDGYTVTCNVSDNVGVTTVKFPSWNCDKHIGDEANWLVGSLSGNTATCRVELSTLKSGAVEGNYMTHIYAYDASGNNKCVAIDKVYIDRTVPVITDSKVIDIDSKGYTIQCKVTDNVGVARVQCPTWTAKKDSSGNSQDDIAANWDTNTSVKATDKGNGIYEFRVNIADHNNEYGIYHTHIYAYDACGNSAMAKLNNIEVADIPVLGDDGWYHCSVLSGDITTDKYNIEYNNYYEKIQKDSPGDGWEKVATVKNEWQNSGNVYTSESELPTSDARVLVKSVYYHFCGPNAGSEGNYAQTGKFVHYDELEIGKFGLNVVSTGNDEGHTYYLLDWSDGGGRVRCKSGVTCDGSYGTHGERCQVWYKMNYYQDRVKVEQYKYTKNSGWVDASDSTAKSVEIRFKEKGGTDISDTPSDYTPGDLNGDDVINSTDVILLRRYIAGGYNVTINEKAADVNADGTINSTDVILIRRYIAGGYGVVLK